MKRFGNEPEIEYGNGGNMYHLFDHYMVGERAYSQMMMAVCEKYALTYAELTVVMFLANNPSLDTASDIVKYQNLAKSHVSVSVRELEEQGMLSREYRDGDRRTVHLCLTAKAKPVISSARAAQQRFANVMLSEISEEEKETLIRILRKIDQNIVAQSLC